MGACSDKQITKEDAQLRLIYLISSASETELERLMNICFGRNELYNYYIVDEIKNED